MFMEAPPYDTSDQPVAGALPVIEDTIAFWQGRGVTLSPEEARCMVKAVRGFFELLDTWDQTDSEKNPTESF